MEYTNKKELEDLLLSEIRVAAKCDPYDDTQSKIKAKTVSNIGYISKIILENDRIENEKSSKKFDYELELQKLRSNDNNNEALISIEEDKIEIDRRKTWIRAAEEIGVAALKIAAYAWAIKLAGTLEETGSIRTFTSRQIGIPRIF